jgi:rfaE bifunctional protein nucleotidyltransferase chain/domain
MIFSRDRVIEELKNFHGTIGFTSGSFDLIHSTHIEVLKKAKELCDLLIVGVNSDRSVFAYKGPKKPIRDEEDRIKVLDSIKYVDYCFLFDEKNNSKNIELIKPNFYIKGGDYKPNQLSSGTLVNKYGGETIILNTPTHISTSSIINNIISKEITTRLSDKKIYNGVVFIDRDGVINKEIEYLHKEEDFKLIDGVADAIKTLNDRDIAVIIVSNQPGISVGLYTDEDFFNINSKMIKSIHKKGAFIDKIYYCPDMRRDSIYKKPNPCMFEEALKNINLKEGAKKYMIGDRKSDSLAAKHADESIYTIGVLTGYGLQDNWINHIPDIVSNNLKEAVDRWIK